jgi:hypothetical protein
MFQTDTLYITDSVSCRYLVYNTYSAQGENVLPIDSLWRSSTKNLTIVPAPAGNVTSEKPDVFLSGIIISFFILLVVFSREIISTLPAVLKALTCLRDHCKLEEKLALTQQRNVVFVISLIYFPVIITLLADNYVSQEFNIYPPFFLIGFFVFLLLFGLAKKLIFKLLSWINRDKVTFNLLEKVGYNHVIIAAIFTFPSVLIKTFSSLITEEEVVFIMAISVLPILFIYLFRSYQIIIGHRFSHFFYILYLCGAEILPLVLIANFILSL